MTSFLSIIKNNLPPLINLVIELAAFFVVTNPWFNATISKANDLFFTVTFLSD